MGVNPKIGGNPPKSSILIGFSIIFTIHFGGFPPIFGNTQIVFCTLGASSKFLVVWLIGEVHFKESWFIGRVHKNPRLDFFFNSEVHPQKVTNVPEILDHVKQINESSEPTINFQVIHPRNLKSPFPNPSFWGIHSFVFKG